MHADIDPEDLRLAVSEMLPGLLANHVYGIIADHVLNSGPDISSVERMYFDLDGDHEVLLVEAQVLRPSLKYGTDTVCVAVSPSEIINDILRSR